jgi:hypothetical protein
MKNKILILAAVTVATVVAGCNRSNTVEENQADNGTNSTSTTLQSVKSSSSNVLESTKEATTNAWANIKEGSSNAWSKTKEMTTNAWDNVKDKFESNAGTNYSSYGYGEKDAMVTQAGADLDALDQKIKTMASKASDASDSIKADAQARLQTLRDQRAALDQKLDAVKNATESDWSDAKATFQNSYNDVDNSVKQTWQWLNDKMGS